MNKNLVIISALFLLFASGCTYPPVRNQLYSGKPLPAQHISVIYPAKTKFFQPKAIIHFVDGKKLSVRMMGVPESRFYQDTMLFPSGS